MTPGSNEYLFAAVRAWVQVNYPGETVDEVLLRLHLHGRGVRLPVPPPVGAPAGGEAFVPNDLQAAVLGALEGRALKTDALAAAADVGRRAMFHHPGGLRELRERGLLEHHHRLGYYRPDAPPEDLAGEQ